MKYTKSSFFAKNDYVRSMHTPNSWILDTRSRNWVRGPRMGTGRSSFGCFHIMEHNTVTNVVVVGGESNYQSLKSAEILDVKTMKWEYLPNLPFKVRSNNGVESVVGPFLGFSLGGFSSNHTGIDYGQKNGLEIEGEKIINQQEARIFGLKKEGEKFIWQQVNSLSTGRTRMASVNAPSSMVPSC